MISEAAPIDLEAELARIIGLRSGGGVALTMRDGETQAGAVGFANADGDPMMVDTGFRTGWMTMGFIAAMVLQLVDEGRVDLDVAVSHPVHGFDELGQGPGIEPGLENCLDGGGDHFADGQFIGSIHWSFPFFYCGF